MDVMLGAIHYVKESVIKGIMLIRREASMMNKKKILGYRMMLIHSLSFSGLAATAGWMRRKCFYGVLVASIIGIMVTPAMALGDGLSSDGSQFWSQEDPGIFGSPEADDQYGSALAWGDFRR
jgi:hypothetical protein